jgi:hypothetical protein
MQDIGQIQKSKGEGWCCMKMPSDNSTSLTAAFLSGLVAGVVLTWTIVKKNSNHSGIVAPPNIIDAIAATASEKLKMVLCVRTDLKMKPGKIACECQS